MYKKHRLHDIFFKERPSRNAVHFTEEQIFERRKLERFLKFCAGEASIKLKKVAVDKFPELEIFFDLYDADGKICYLLKQWNSSILRFGDTVKLDRSLVDFKERFYKIHHICAVNYITILFPPPGKNVCNFEMSLETAVYLENFDERILGKVIERFKNIRFDFLSAGV